MPLKVKNKEEYNAYMRNYQRKKKHDLIAKMGGKCQRCGDTRIEFLGIAGGKVYCHNCRDFLKIKKGRSVKRESKN